MGKINSIADIRLPSSSNRRNPACFLKLLSRVDPAAENGFGFEGRLLRPGSATTFAELRPDARYPAIPILLEHSLAPAHGIAGHRRSDSVYILWKWDLDRYEWCELGRATAASWEWAVALRPIAIRALAEAHGKITVLESAPDLMQISNEISGFLDERLALLKPPDRARLLAILHDQFAIRLCA